MKTNIATTSEQSQRLLRCGVSADTADMCWHGAIVPRGGSLTSMPEPSEEWDLGVTPYSCMPEELQAAKLMEDYNEIQPAWSLSALLDILPKELTDYRMTHRYEPFTDFVMTCCAPYFINGSLHLYHNGKKYVVDYDWDGFLGQMPCADDPIEACVLAIELLAANGYKLNEI